MNSLSPAGRNGPAGPGRSSSSDPEKIIAAVPAGEVKMVTTTSDSEVSSVRKGEDILALQDLDPALNAKMHLVNNVSDSLSIRAGVLIPPPPPFCLLMRSKKEKTNDGR